MLFSFYEFLFCFLPITIIGYYLILNAKKVNMARVWLVIASLFFYGWFNIKYLPIIIISILINFVIGKCIKKEDKHKKIYFIIGSIFNVGLLCYFKYYDFFVENVNILFKTNWTLKHLLLPLGISFFSFQQLSYLIDVYKGETKDYSLLNFSLFVTFFPQLIAGPIVLHSEIMPQFDDKEKQKLNWDNIASGIFMFSMGFFKKLVIADSFAIWATNGFDSISSLTFYQAWFISLSYTIQIYFDFSGYSDMAVGIGKIFNIDLPANFLSPYKATSISEFWRRWHITLGRALSTYVYKPLGGNRKGRVKTYINLLLTFLVSGLWHGAAWTFVFWGLLHGIASVIDRLFRDNNWKINKYVSWILTFMFVNCAWVFFRATTFERAFEILTAMFSVPSGDVLNMAGIITNGSIIIIGLVYILLVISLVVTLSFKNTYELAETFDYTTINTVYVVILMVVGISFMPRISPFIYFNF